MPWVGTVLEAARERRGLSMESVAVATDGAAAGRSTIDKWEKGVYRPRSPDRSQVEAYLRALDKLTPDDPVAGDELTAVWAAFHECTPDELPARLGIAGHDAPDADETEGRS